MLCCAVLCCAALCCARLAVQTVCRCSRSRARARTLHPAACYSPTNFCSLQVRVTCSSVILSYSIITWDSKVSSLLRAVSYKLRAELRPTHE